MKWRNSIGLPGFLLSVGLLAWCAAAGWAQLPVPPTEEHQTIAREAGVWKASLKVWMRADQKEPFTSEATETNTLLGPYWLLSEFKGNLGGIEFVGRGQFGYDPVAKKFVGTWIDSMTPFLATMEGQHDAEKDELTMIVTARDPETGKNNTTTNVTRFIDEDTKVFTIHQGVEGDENRWQMMEIEYKRVK